MENEEKQYIRVTLEWIKEHYDKANRELFDGELGDCQFALKQTSKGFNTNATFSISGSFAGKLYANRYSRRIYLKSYYSGQITYVNRDNFVDICHPTITFVENKVATEKALYTSLVHEMCHYYTYMNGYCPKQGHGTEFKRIANYASSKTNEIYNVQTHASMEQKNDQQLDTSNQTAKDKRIENKKLKLQYIMVLMPDKTGRLISTTNENLINKITQIETKNNNKVIKITNKNISDELYNMGYSKALRTYSFWEFNPDEPIFQKILNTSNNYEFLNENIVKNKIHNNSIEISPDMNLSEMSPLEMLQETKTKICKKILFTESQLKKIIRESIKNILSENIITHVFVDSRVKGVGKSSYSGGYDEMTLEELQKIMDNYNACVDYKGEFYDNVNKIPFKKEINAVKQYAFDTGKHIETNPKVTLIPKGTHIEKGYGSKKYVFPQENSK